MATPCPTSHSPSRCVRGVQAAAAPAEAFRAALVGLDELPARIRRALGRILVGLVPPAQFDGIELQCIRELVERGFQRERPDRLPWRAHPGIGHRVETDDLLADEQGLRCVEMPRRKRQLLGVACVIRRGGDAGMNQRREPAVAVRAKGDALLRQRPSADVAIDLFARQRESHRTSGDSRRRRADHAVVPQCRPCRRTRRRQTARSR